MDILMHYIATDVGEGDMIRHDGKDLLVKSMEWERGKDNVLTHVTFLAADTEQKIFRLRYEADAGVPLSMRRL